MCKVATGSCTIECFDDGSCSNADVDCVGCDPVCKVKCLGNESCNNMSIIQNQNKFTKIDLECTGMDSCRHIEFVTDLYEDKFLCECIPIKLYNLFHQAVVDMIQFVKDEEKWVYAFSNLINAALEYYNDDSDDDTSVIIEDVMRALIPPQIYEMDVNLNCESTHMDQYTLITAEYFNIKYLYMECTLNNTRYLLLDHIGSGSIGSVFKARRIFDDDIEYDHEEIVAIKFVNTKNPLFGWKLLRKEIASSNLANQLLHGSGVAIYDSSNIDDIFANNAEKQFFVLVMEYLPDGSIQNYMTNIMKNGNINNNNTNTSIKQEEFAVFFSCRVLDDVSYSMMLLNENDNQILHNDIKPANILMDLNEMVFKIADYGDMFNLNYLLNENEREQIGSYYYRSPIISRFLNNIKTLKGSNDSDVYRYLSKYFESSDMYSLFVTVLSLYQSLCDPNVDNSECKQFNEFDLNVEAREDDFVTTVKKMRENNECTDTEYCAQAERHKRLLAIEDIDGKSTVFGLLKEYLLAFYEYKNINININENDGTDSDLFYWSTFRSDLETVCNKYIKKDDEYNEYPYQLWVYDDKTKRILLKDIFGDLDNSICISNNANYIIWDSVTETVSKTLEFTGFDYDIAGIQSQLRETAYIFNQNFFHSMD